MLGGESEPYQGCFSESCLDKEPAWTTAKVCVRCSYCNAPMSFGRTWKTARDQVQYDMDKLRIRMMEDMNRWQYMLGALRHAPKRGTDDN